MSENPEIARRGRAPRAVALALLVSAALGASSCSLNAVAADYTAKASNAFLSEYDPELAKAALPTFIKISETMLSGDPRNADAAVATASLYVMYANAFIDGPASMLPDDLYELAASEYRRAADLYRRASALLLPIVEKRCPGFLDAAGGDSEAAKRLSAFGKADVPLLYWTGAAVFARWAIDLTNVDAAESTQACLLLLERARELDPEWNGASVPSLLVSLYAALPESMGGGMDKARAAYEQALELAGPSAGLYVANATVFCVPAQDYEGFSASLEAALALPLDGGPSTLLTALAQQKASWLLENAAKYFRRLPTTGE